MRIRKGRRRLRWLPPCYYNGLLLTDYRIIRPFAAFLTKGRQAKECPVCSLEYMLRLLQQFEKLSVVSLPKEIGLHRVVDSNTMEARSTLPTVSKPSLHLSKPSVILLHYTGKALHQTSRPRKLLVGVQWTTPREELTQPAVILKEEPKDACTFDDSLVVSVFYSTSGTDINTRINARAQANTIDSSLESMELVARGVTKILRPGSIRFSIDLRQTKSSHDFRFLTRPSPVPASLTLNRNCIVLLHKWMSF